MNFSRSNCSPLARNPVVQRSLDLRFRGAQARYYLKWCTINVLILSLLLFDTWQACRSFYRTYYFLAECTATAVMGLSALACFAKYLWL